MIFSTQISKSLDWITCKICYCKYIKSAIVIFAYCWDKCAN